MFTLKKLDIASVAMYSFIMILIISIIFVIPVGIFFMALSNLIPDTGMQSTEFSNILPFFSWIFIILLPLFYAILGTIVNVLIALLYNFLSKKLGGIKFSLEKIGDVSVTEQQ